MAKLGILFLVALVCLHASLGDAGHRKLSSGLKWVKSRFGSKSTWESGKPPVNKVNGWGDESEDHEHGNMPNEEMSGMMKMRMRLKKMLEPLRNLFVKVLGLGSKKTAAGRPAFCGDNECPAFKVLNKSANYELRMYPASQWVSTKMEATKMNKMVKKTCFWRLFKYIQGNNELDQKIKMTVPVTNLIKTCPISGNINYTMSFYLPPSVTNPPTPDDGNVWINKKGSFKVYVHSFDGYAMSQKTWKKHVNMLQNMLHKDGLSGKYYTYDEMYVTAGYDDPMKLFDRHNEVWLLAKDQEA